MAFAKLSSALLVCDRNAVVIAPAPAPAQASAPAAAATLRLVPPQPAPPPPPAPRAELPRSNHDRDDAKRLAHHLKALRLPMFLSECDHLAEQCAAEDADYQRFLLRLAELELGERKRRSVERRLKTARFPAMKSFDEFVVDDVPPPAAGMLVKLMRGDFVAHRENVIAVGPSGSGKTHVAVALGAAACRKDQAVGFINAAALVHELREACNERRLSRLQRRYARYRLLIVDDLGAIKLPSDGAELLFHILCERCERASTMITSTLPPAEWGRVFGERLAGTLVDRLSRRGHLLELA